MKSNLKSGKFLLLEFRIQNPGNFGCEIQTCRLWNPDFILMIGNPSSTDAKSGIQFLESGIQSLESRIQYCLRLPYGGEKHCLAGVHES